MTTKMMNVTYSPHRKADIVISTENLMMKKEHPHSILEEAAKTVGDNKQTSMLLQSHFWTAGRDTSDQSLGTLKEKVDSTENASGFNKILSAEYYRLLAHKNQLRQSHESYSSVTKAGSQ